MVLPMNSAVFLLRKRMMHQLFSVMKYSYYGHSEKQKIQCSQDAASSLYCILNSFLNPLSGSILKTGDL